MSSVLSEKCLGFLFGVSTLVSVVTSVGSLVTGVFLINLNQKDQYIGISFAVSGSLYFIVSIVIYVVRDREVSLKPGIGFLTTVLLFELVNTIIFSISMVKQANWIWKTFTDQGESARTVS